jgi:DNA topoisomerase-1
LLEQHFPDLVDEGFTAAMEAALDEIAAGKIDWRSYLEEFYSGEKGFEARLTDREDAIDPREASTVDLSDLRPRVRIGRYGPFLELERDGERLTAAVPEDVPPADLSNETALQLIEARAAGPQSLGDDPESGETVFLLSGRFGPYVQLGEPREGSEKPPRASLPKGMGPEDVTLETALKLLAMPLELGPHPDTQKPVKVGIGRYGPYVVHEGDYRSLTADDDPLSVGLDRALELLAQPKRGRGKSRSSKPVRDLGVHPGDGKPVAVYAGRYGPYVKHGRTNASLPKDSEVDEITLEEALGLLEARRERDRAKKRSRSAKK